MARKHVDLESIGEQLETVLGILKGKDFPVRIGVQGDDFSPFLMPKIADKDVDWYELTKCTAEILNLPHGNRRCYRVSADSFDKDAGADAKVEVKWTDLDGAVTDDELKSGEHTECKENMKRVQVHAKDTDAIIKIIRCNCP